MSYETTTLDTFLSEIASQQVAPAGGSSAAVVGAIGTSLCEMTCIHTIGKDGYSDVESELRSTRSTLTTCRGQLLQLANLDATVVEELLEAPGENRQRKMKRSIGVPLTIAQACLTVLESATVVTAKGSDPALTDAIAGILFVDAALEAAVLTVRTNLEYITDTDFIEKIERTLRRIESTAAETLDGISSNGLVETL
ncbi:cyclodeaminase/cyclohydrolase family protein [Natrarchaeobius chitinivorans]|nr:cyclodeaminase/cyclohydrolase family protein [Natrarchaeobius chitinivorans]